MDDFQLLGLALRAVSTALVVVAATVAAERLGPFWGGLIACLPVSAGPAYVLLALDRSPDFVAGAALASLAANVATWTFLLVAAHLSLRGYSLLVALGGALIAWFALVVIIEGIDATLIVVLIGNVVAFVFADRLAPRVSLDPARFAVRRRGWLELPARAAMVGVFVVAVVAVSDAIGPAATGIAAVFPIALSSLMVVATLRFGAKGGAVAAASAIRPLVGIALGLTVVHLAVPQWGVWAGLGAGLAATLAWPLAMIVSRRAAVPG
ncbi:MAG: hypothetical protein SFV21_03760 [Rhodospirillaceae bacterium]|nr:hypothetical protein [Rhodospirillaceae bacterium]